MSSLAVAPFSFTNASKVPSRGTFFSKVQKNFEKRKKVNSTRVREIFYPKHSKLSQLP